MKHKTRKIDFRRNPLESPASEHHVSGLELVFVAKGRKRAVDHLSLEPETARELLLALLRGAAYFFAGFALLALFTYVVFLCLEIFSPRPRAKVKIAEIPPQVGRDSMVEQNHDLVPAKAPILAESPSITAEEVMQEGLNLGIFVDNSVDQRLPRSGADVDFVQENLGEERTAMH